MDLKTVFYDWGGANVDIFHIFNDITNPFYVHLMVIGSDLGRHTLFPLYLTIILAVALYTIRTERVRGGNYVVYSREWLEVLAVLLLAYGFSWLWVDHLKHFMHMPRPFIALPEGTFYVLDAVKHKESPMLTFPSGHTAFAVTLVASLWPILSDTWKKVAIAYMLWVMVSRVALAAHFPADVVWTFFIASVAVVFVRNIVGMVFSLIFSVKRKP